MPSSDVPTRGAVWPAFVTFAAAMVLVFLATIAWVFGVALVHSAGDLSRVSSEATRFAYSAPGITGAALVSATVLAAVSFTAARVQTKRVIARLRLGRSRATAVGVGAAVSGVVGLNAATGALSDLLGRHGQGNMEIITQALYASSPIRILVAAGCFGVMHLDALQGVVAFFAGIFLGWAVERFEGIRPSIAAHVLNNSLVVVLASHRSDDRESAATNVAAIGFGLLLLGGAVVLIRSRFSTRPSASLGE